MSSFTRLHFMEFSKVLDHNNMNCQPDDYRQQNNMAPSKSTANADVPASPSATYSSSVLATLKSSVSNRFSHLGVCF